MNRQQFIEYLEKGKVRSTISNEDIAIIEEYCKEKGKKDDEICLFLSLLCTTFARPILIVALATSKDYYKRKFNISTLIHGDKILTHY